MNTNTILAKVYKSSATVIVSAMLLICFIFHWPIMMIGVTLLASLVISSPATILLHVLAWLTQKRKLEGGFIWMLLMAFIPLFALIAAWLCADFVPGKIWFLLLLGIVSGYVGILSHGISIAQFFNADDHEE